MSSRNRWPSTSAKVRQNSAAETRATPGRSSVWTAVGFLLSGTRRQASSTPAAPIGMFTRKIQRQLSAAVGQATYCTMRPPAVGPMAVAKPETPPQTPIAAPRLAAGKTAAMIDSVAGIMAAPPAPCSRRKAISQ